MGYMIEITESKVEHLADTIGKMLHYGGMAMHCVEEMRQEHGYMGERGGMSRYGMREHEMPREDYDRMGERYTREPWDEEPYMMGERRGRSAYTGRYIRR